MQSQAGDQACGFAWGKLQVFAMPEERSWESNLVPAPSSIGFSCCWTVLFQPRLGKLTEFVFVIFFLSIFQTQKSHDRHNSSPLSVLGGTLRSRLTEQALWADDSVSPQVLENGVNWWDWRMGQAGLWRQYDHKGDKLCMMTSPGQRDRPGVCAASLCQRMHLLILVPFLR